MKIMIIISIICFTLIALAGCVLPYFRTESKPPTSTISSPLGILAMYACILSHERAMPFHISLLSSDTDNTMYCVGFLIATTGTGIVNSAIDFSTGMITVINYVDVVKADIEEWIKSQPQQGALHNLKEKIDAYFSSTCYLKNRLYQTCENLKTGRFVYHEVIDINIFYRIKEMFIL